MIFYKRLRFVDEKRSRAKQFFCVMKMTLFLVLAAIMQVSASTTLAQRVTLQERNAKLEKVFEDIKQQTGYVFFYKVDVLKNTPSVNLNLKDASLQETLDAVFKDQPLEYTVAGNTIGVKKRGDAPAKQGAILRQIDVRGTVTDDKGMPLPGAVVRVKGASVDAQTDINGRFLLKNVPDNAVLTVTFIGYATQEVAVNQQTNITIALKEELKALNEVVVVGYGAQKKANLTGAVSQVAGSELSSRPITSVGSGLQGQMAGVTVNVQRGLPGNNGGVIRVRGIGTLNDANALIVIDGLPNTSADINILNPEDIESISVLKDAAASSIYGVRGANGVILITTKKGGNTAPTLSYNNYFGFQKPIALPKYLGSVEYMQLLNEAKVNAGQNPTYTDAQIEIARNGSDPNYYANTDWIGAIYKKTAPQQNHNLNLSGGAKNINYYLSYGYIKEGGFLVGDNYFSKRQTIRARVTATVFDRLQLDANVGYIDRGYSESNESTNASAGPISVAQLISPLVPVKFTNGSWGYLGGSRNPVAVLTDGGYNLFNSGEITANLQATLNITKDFRLRSQYGLVKSNSLREVFAKTIDYISPDDNTTVIYRTNFPNSLTNTDYSNMYQVVNGIAEYEHTFAKQHYLKAFVAVSSEETINKQFGASRTSFPTQDLAILNLGTLNQLNSGFGAQNALRSAFGRVNYAYAGKYLLEGNFRRDGSSRFAPNVRWNTFLSGSAGWVFSEEKFFQPLRNIIDLGKIRVSYGNQGNDRTSDNAYLSTITSFTSMPIGNVLTTAYREANVANSLLTWETSTKKDIGIDLSMFNGKLGITADYYHNVTNGILLSPQLPDVFGVRTYPPQNAGKVENKGWELSITYRNKWRDLGYSFTGNLSDVRNKVLSLGTVSPSFGDQVRFVGEAIDSFYGFEALRISQASDYTFNAANNTYTPNFPYDPNYPMRPGDVMYQDLDGDGKITEAGDKKIIGSPIPRYTYGLTANFDYKGIDLRVFVQGVGKADGYVNGAARYAFINDSSNPQEFHLDRWTPQNTGASYPRLVYGYSYNQRLSTKWLEDASYFRLKTVQIGYTLPKALTERYRVGRLRVYASGENLYTGTNFFYGYDPESPVTAGGFYPVPRTFVFGLNLTLR